MKGIVIAMLVVVSCEANNHSLLGDLNLHIVCNGFTPPY